MLFSKGYSLRPIVWHACLEAGFTPKIAFEGEETDTIRGLVAAGMGSACFLKWRYSDESSAAGTRPDLGAEGNAFHRSDPPRGREAATGCSGIPCVSASIFWY